MARVIEDNIEDRSVDCEYHHNGYKIKSLKYALVENGDIEDKTVVPDIIVHRRGTNENLLAIEIKKDTNKENRYKDYAKLRAYRDQLGYQYTLFIDFRVGQNPGIINV